MVTTFQNKKFEQNPQTPGMDFQHVQHSIKNYPSDQESGIHNVNEKDNQLMPTWR